MICGEEPTKMKEGNPILVKKNSCQHTPKINQY